MAWRREFPAHFLFWLPRHIQLLNSLLCDINLFLLSYHHRCIAVYASHIKPKVSLGLGAGRMQKHGCEDPGNMCQSLSAASEAARAAVWCSRSVFLPMALWFIIKPSPSEMEGGMGLPSARRWGNSGHLCSEALQTAPARHGQTVVPSDSQCSEPEPFTKEFTPATLLDKPLDPSGLLKRVDRWPLPKTWLQSRASDRVALNSRFYWNVFVFDKVTNIFAIKGSASARFARPYNATTLYTTSWQTW